MLLGPILILWGLRLLHLHLLHLHLLHLHMLLLWRRRRRRHDVPTGPLPLIVGLLPLGTCTTIQQPLGTNQRPHGGIDPHPSPPLGHLPRLALHVDQMGNVPPEDGAVAGMDLDDATPDGDGIFGGGGMQQ